MKIFLLYILSLLSTGCFAQADRPKDLFTFHITDYMVKLNDSVVLVQTEPPPGASIAEGQLALLKSNSNFILDTTMIGFGKCQLIKGSYYYFAIHLDDKNRLPKKGDLLYTRMNYPASYMGRIFGLIQHDIYFQKLAEKPFYGYAFSVFGDLAQETSVLESMAEDIRYTAGEMLKISPGQNRVISYGKFRDKKLFTVMQEISAGDVGDFIDYLLRNPTRYEGNNWKISETFATWIVNGAPAAEK